MINDESERLYCGDVDFEKWACEDDESERLCCGDVDFEKWTREVRCTYLY
jgi:hypothetical protein